MSNKYIETMNQNEQEFERQVRAHKATIYTVCYMFSKAQDEVADLYQECLINLWHSWPNFEHRSDVRTWIYRICLNVCVSLERKRHRHKTIPLTMDINPYEEDNQNSRQMEILRQRINQAIANYSNSLRLTMICCPFTEDYSSSSGMSACKCS